MPRRVSAPVVLVALSALVACSDRVPFALRSDAATDDVGRASDAAAESDGSADASAALTHGCPTPIDPDGRCVGSLSVGEATACAIVEGGGVRCWGWAGLGMFGEGPRVRSCTAPLATSHACSPAPIAARIAGATSIVVGNRHVCALTDAVHCWGTTDDCAVGAATTPDAVFPNWIDVPTSLAGTEGATALRSYAASDANDTGTCARVGDALRCWGPASPGGATACAPSTVWTGTFDTFFVGPWVSYGVRSGDAWQAWGSGESLAPCGGTVIATPAALPVPASTLEIDLGRVHACARTAAGVVVCWGQNVGGSLGLAMRDPSRVTTPTEVDLPEPATHLAVADDHACALLASGRVACWGREAHELLGQGPGAPVDCGPNPPSASIPCASAPVLVDGLDDAIDLATGTGSTCARRASGRVVCWGDNTYGQLGDGTFDDATRPIEVLDI